MESLSILLIGDPHFKIDNVQETDLLTQKLLDLVKKRKPTFVVCLGDTLDRFERIHVNPLEHATNFFSQLNDLAPLYVIIGNHDRPNNSNFLTSEHPFNALKKWSQTMVVDTPVMTIVDNRKFISVPYVFPGRFFEALSYLFGLTEEYLQRKNTLSKIPNDDSWREQHLKIIVELFGPHLQDVTAIFAHQEFYKAKMGAIESRIGDDYPLSFPTVYSGHIHDYDELQTNIIYIGTPMHHEFGDHGKKTVSIITFQPELSNSRTTSHERIDLQLPKKISIRLDYDEIESYDPPPNSVVKLNIWVTKSQRKVIYKLTKIKSFISQGIKISLKDKSETLDNENNSNTSIVKSSGRGISYSQRLYLRVQSDEDQKKIYERLYGSMKETVIEKSEPVVKPLKLKIVSELEEQN